MRPFHSFGPGHPRKLAEIGRKGDGIQTGHETVVFGHIADDPANGVLILEDIVAENFSLSPLRF